ncbi:hypothetical protein HMPREF9431_01563 [Segatella oulorum F0390]|uniref:Uncharacterized protein n=1 Tax=Segatella oulorum F0390 TaxID=702438 RepID=G1WCL2_9BACT|nr:hypothetical protein [Segatella oulorum]EGV30554.1 hypothetical protein HMPREF9431_01563 [Segatella oulorum F0390]
MAKKRKQNRKNELSKKGAVESIRFQTHIGLKQIGHKDTDMFHRLADTEINVIAELDLTDDILGIKNLVEGVKRELNVEPILEKGDFCTSIVAIALRISKIPVLDDMKMPVVNWQDRINKKILTLYYPEESRNAVAEWAKANDYNTSTYLGRPVVKFKRLFIIIERTRTRTE